MIFLAAEMLVYKIIITVVNVTQIIKLSLYCQHSCFDLTLQMGLWCMLVGDIQFW